MILVGISGLAGSGKDTFAKELRKVMDVFGIRNQRVALADPIKDILAPLFGWDERHMFGELKEVVLRASIKRSDYTPAALKEHFRSFIPEEVLNAQQLNRMVENFHWVFQSKSEIFYYNEVDGESMVNFVLSPRQAFQWFGTEVARSARDDVWFALMMHRAPDAQVTLVPDIRFENEHELLLYNDGLVVYIDRPDVKAVSNHVSEQYTPKIAEHESTYVIHNDGYSLIPLRSAAEKYFEEVLLPLIKKEWEDEKD